MYMAGVAGFEPAHGGIKTRCLTAWLYPIGLSSVFLKYRQKMAGVAGFEPAHGGIKTRCLTAWLYPNYFPTTLVRKERLELSRPRALEPKSSVSTNSTTPAYFYYLIRNILT
jgi:hypothetical protein